MQPNTHAQDVEGVLKSSNVIASTGLTQVEADKRLAEFGPNLLIEKGAKSPWRILWEQFTATMVLILVGAGALS
ncbi:MAG: cation-transporting P-type ATPase, partial [Thermoflexales bacterium]